MHDTLWLRHLGVCHLVFCKSWLVSSSDLSFLFGGGFRPETKSWSELPCLTSCILSRSSAPGDFVFLRRTLTFSPLDSELTVAVTVQDDAVVEGEEEFFVVVAAAPGERGVMIPQNSAVVVSITDNDSMRLRGREGGREEEEE